MSSDETCACSSKRRFGSAGNANIPAVPRIRPCLGRCGAKPRAAGGRPSFIPGARPARWACDDSGPPCARATPARPARWAWAVNSAAWLTRKAGFRPNLKAAIIGTDIFVGDNQLIALKNIKTKNELIGEVIGLLMSPISRVLSGLTQRAEKEGAEAEPATAE